MNRHVTTQVIAILVVLSMLLRWIPGEGHKDPLGRGDPLMCLEMDAHLLRLGGGMRAFLRGIRQVDPDGYRLYWTRRFKEVDKILATADEDTFVQFKGVPRNAQWQLSFDLYPVRSVGKPSEEGSTNDDPTMPGATVMSGRLRAPQDMGVEEKKRFREAARKRIDRELEMLDGGGDGR